MGSNIPKANNSFGVVGFAASQMNVLLFMFVIFIVIPESCEDILYTVVIGYSFTEETLIA